MNANGRAPRRAQKDRVKRLVVKIGSNVLTTKSHKLSETVVKRLVEDVVELRARGLEVAIVTSGAVAAACRSGARGGATEPKRAAHLL